MLPWGWEVPGDSPQGWPGRDVQAQRKESGRSRAEAARRGWNRARRGPGGRMPGREAFFPVLRGDTVRAGHSQVRWVMHA